MGGSNNPVSIAFNMHSGSLNAKTGLYSFNLEMPVADMANKTKPEEYPPVVLEIRDADQIACLSRMKQLQHHNILGVQFFDDATTVDNTPCIRVYTEMYTGRVSDLFIPRFFVDDDTKMVNSSLKALYYIFRNDSYHGNFSWNTTLYQQDEKDGTRTLKLSNFEMKNKSLLECQLGDVHALGHALEEVSFFVSAEYPDCTEDTCILLNDLAYSLMTVTMNSLSKMKEDHEDHVFFWDGKRKKSFYAYEIPQVWDNPIFLQSFRGSRSLPLMPWDTKWKTDVFLERMKDYRRKNGIAKYDMHDLADFIRFICGMYTHQEYLVETKIPHRSVDVAVHDIHPRLLLDFKVATDAAKVAIDAAAEIAGGDDMDLDK